MVIVKLLLFWGTRPAQTFGEGDNAEEWQGLLPKVDIWNIIYENREVNIPNIIFEVQHDE